MSIGLVIFDKDGVIIDTEPGKTKSYWLALRELARPADLSPILDIGGDFWDEIKYCHWHAKELTGRSRQEVIEGIFARFGEIFQSAIIGHEAQLRQELSSPAEVQKELDNPSLASDDQRIFSALRLKLYYDMPLEERARPIEAIIAFMQTLLRACIPIALITESKYDRTIKELRQLERFGIGLPAFRVIACKDGIFAAGQKAAEGGQKQEMYEKILFLTCNTPQECLVLEDTDKGQAAALAAGLTCFKVYFPGAS